jgi:hypothetical protein
MTVQVAERDLSLLRPLLERYRRVVGDMWTRYVLIRPGKCELMPSLYRYEAKDLVGSRIPFRPRDLVVTHKLLGDSLCLWNHGMRRVLPLLPLIRVVTLKALPSEMAAYFLSGLTRGAQLFTSYHAEAEPEVNGVFADTGSALRALSRAIGSGRGGTGGGRQDG